jgi:glycopeptide antibiotics resistance protein
LLFPLGLLGPIALPVLGRWWRLALVAILYSGTIEFTQIFIPDRSADVDDVIVNVTGALLGFVVWWLVLRRFSEDGTKSS